MRWPLPPDLGQRVWLIRQILLQEAQHISAHNGADFVFRKPRLQHFVGENRNLGNIEGNGCCTIIIRAQRNMILSRNPILLDLQEGEAVSSAS